jgi:hypothetical protein
MRFKPTGIFEWILVGYGGLAALVALVVIPLVLGLGDGTARSSVGADPCRAAVERLIRCADRDQVRRKLKDSKEKFIRGCKQQRQDIRKAERCVKETSCKAFQRCLVGG